MLNRLQIRTYFFGAIAFLSLGIASDCSAAGKPAFERDFGKLAQMLTEQHTIEGRTHSSSLRGLTASRLRVLLADVQRIENNSPFPGLVDSARAYRYALYSHWVAEQLRLTDRDIGDIVIDGAVELAEAVAPKLLGGDVHWDEFIVWAGVKMVEVAGRYYLASELDALCIQQISVAREQLMRARIQQDDLADKPWLAKKEHAASPVVVSLEQKAQDKDTPWTLHLRNDSGKDWSQTAFYITWSNPNINPITCFHFVESWPNGQTLTIGLKPLHIQEHSEEIMAYRCSASQHRFRGVRLFNFSPSVELPRLDEVQEVKLVDLIGQGTPQQASLEMHTDLAQLERLALRAGNDCEYSFSVVQNPMSHEWALYAHVHGVGSNSTKTALAVARLCDRELRFRWLQDWSTTSDLGQAICRQFQNCSLELKYDGEERIVALRKPAEMEPMLLDFNKTAARFQSSLPEIPLGHKLVIEAPYMVIDNRFWIMMPVTSRENNHEVRFRFQEFDNVQFAVEIENRSNDNLNVTFKPLFVEGSREYPLTFDRLDTSESANRKIVEAYPNKIANTKRLVAVAISEFNRIPRLQIRSAAKKAMALNSKQRIENLERRLNSEQEQLAEARIRLAAIPRIRAFMRAANEKMQVGVRVVAVGEGHEIPLVQTKRPRVNPTPPELNLNSALTKLQLAALLTIKP